MNSKAIVCLALLLLRCSVGFAFHLDLQPLNGQKVYDPQFVEDYEWATAQMSEGRSLGALLSLVERYTGPVEQAELQLTIGLAYGQQAGLVDPGKAVEYFSRALSFDLPEKTSLRIFLWRGNSYEQLKLPRKALEDYLRALIACSYYDLSREWPAIEKPPKPVYTNSRDPENPMRTRDYNRYRYGVDFIQFLMTQKYGSVEGIRRLQAAGISEATILTTLGDLTPDAHAIETVKRFLKEENRRPWP